MDRLVLWDIDRTLVNISGVSHDIYAVAFMAVSGRTLDHMPDMAGKTDCELVASVLAIHDIPIENSKIDKFYQCLAEAAHEHKAEMMKAGMALAGAKSAITALSQAPRTVQSLVTGNIEAIARQKLSLFDLAEGIDFEVGGYGSDSHDRAVLVQLARQRAERKYRCAVPGKRIIVIGDTPHDIHGAKANGVLAVGVASGSSSATELEDAGADLVLPSLVDIGSLLDLLAGTTTDHEQTS